jgi:hypothetical protein
MTDNNPQIYGIIEDTFIPDANYDGEFSGPKDYATMLSKAKGCPSWVEHKPGTCIGTVTDVKALPHVKNYLACEITLDKKLPAAKKAWEIIERKRGSSKVGLSFHAQAYAKKPKSDGPLSRLPYHNVIEVSVVDEPRVENAYVFALRENGRFRVSKSMGRHLAEVNREQSRLINVQNSLSSSGARDHHNTNFSKSKESLFKMSESSNVVTTTTTTPEIDLNTPAWREKILGKLGAKTPEDLDPLANIQEQQEETLRTGFKNIAPLIQAERPDLVHAFANRDVTKDAKENYALYDMMFSLAGRNKREQDVKSAEAQKKKEQEVKAVEVQKQEQTQVRKRTFADVFYPEKPQFVDSGFAGSFANENVSNLDRAVEIGLKDGAQTLYKEELKKAEKIAHENAGTNHGGATLGSFFSSS